MNWDQVVANPEFQKLTNTQKQQARDQYFDSVIAPKVTAEQRDAAKTQFNNYSKPHLGPSNLYEHAVDFAKSIPQGFVSGLSKTLGSSGALMNADQIAFSPFAGSRAIIPDLPKPTETEAAIKQNITGELPQPKGAGGQIGAAIGGAFGDPISYVGPAGPIRAVASSAISSGMGEGAAEALKGTKFETIGRILASMAAPTFAKTKVPSVMGADELKAISDKQFDQFRKSGFAINPAINSNLQITPTLQPWAQKTIDDLASRGFNERSAKNTIDEVRHIGGSPVVDAIQLENARQALGQIAKNGESAAAHTARNSLFDYINSLPPGATNNPAALQTQKEAIGNWAGAQRANWLDFLEERGTRLAEAKNSGRNSGNNVKGQFVSWLNNPSNKNGVVGYTPEEIAAIEKMLKGSRGENTARTLSNMTGGGGGIGRTMTLLAPYAIGGTAAGGGAYGYNSLYGDPSDKAGPGMLGALGVLAGALSRRYYNNSVARNVDEIQQLSASRAPANATLATQRSAIQQQNAIAPWLQRAINAVTQNDYGILAP